MNIIVDGKGNKIVEIDTILFNSKRKIDWVGVEKYLKKYIGEFYEIVETGDIVYIGADLPDEYTSSEYRRRALGTIGKAKANAAQAIPSLIEIATDGVFRENLKEKHQYDAKYGWYKYCIRFSLPVCDDKKNVVGRNIFKGTMLIRHAFDGKKYLYDIIDIKKET